MRTIRSFIAPVAVALVVAACASGAAQGEIKTAGGATVGGTDYAGEPGRPVGELVGPATAPAIGAPPAPAGQPDSFSGPDAIAVRDDARIIRTGSIELEVIDLAKALQTARNTIVGLGGYIGASNNSNTSNHPTAEITYRIPADRWEDALDALHVLNGLTSKVVNEQTQAIEVTGQVIDLQARIKNLEASETALQGIAEKAVKISDVLEVQARLTEVRGQIEQLTAQLVDLNDRAGYATLTAVFSVPLVAVEIAAEGWQPATIVDEAAASLISISQAVAGAGIWFLIVWLPLLLVLGLLLGLVALVVRRTALGRRSSGSSLIPPTSPASPVV